MKRILGIMTLSAVLIACQTEEKPQAEAQAEVQEAKYASYGEEIDDAGAITYAEMMEQLKSNDTVNVKLSGEIDKTCQMKGCWMEVNVAEGQDPMRVTFKDYGFFVPKEGVEEHATIFEGQAYVDTISVDALRHYAQDSGASAEEIEAITEPEVVVTFEASGVLISD